MIVERRQLKIKKKILNSLITNTLNNFAIVFVAVAVGVE